MRLRYSARARAQLEAIKVYLRDRDQAIAERVGRAIRTTAERLRNFPHIGRLGRSPGTREVLVNGLPYLLVYEIHLGSEDELVVLGVFHVAQDR
jgi:plasmid stabilization system protein ParE